MSSGFSSPAAGSAWLHRISRQRARGTATSGMNGSAKSAQPHMLQFQRSQGINARAERPPAAQMEAHSLRSQMQMSRTKQAGLWV